MIKRAQIELNYRAVAGALFGLDSNLYDLGIDPLSSLEILVALEDKYDIRIPQDRLKNANSVREIIRVVSSQLRKKGTGI